MRLQQMQTTLMKNELDLFANQLSQTAIDGHTLSEVRSVGQVNEHNPIVFQLSGHEDEFLDPIFFLKVKAKIKSSTGTTLPADSAVSLVNNFGHTMFKRIELKLQDSIITSSTDNYAYRAYIERLLNYGQDAKNTQLALEMFYKDEAGKFDSFSATENQGHADRQDIVAKSKTFTTFIRISTDLANQPKLLPNLVDVCLVLHQQTNAFRLCYTSPSDEPKLEIIDIVLFVRHVKLSTPMAAAMAETLRLQPARYPISRVEVKSYQINAGLTLVNRENISMGRLPRLVVLGLVDSDAHMGSCNKSPFNFQNKGVSFVSLYKDSQPVPSVALTPNWKEGDAVREYVSLFQTAGFYGANRGNDISYQDYLAGGYVLYAFDLTADESATSYHSSMFQQGNLSLKLQANQGGIDQPTTLIVYLVYDSVLYIDNHRNIVKDFA